MGWAAIARFGGIGDNLIASSVLPGLKKKYGHVEVLSQDPQSAVFENNPHIDKLTLKKPEDFPKDAIGWQDWFVNRGKEYDFFANLSHSCETTVALSRAQTAFYWPEDFRRRWCDHSYLEVVHDICGVPHEYSPGMYFTEEEVAKARDTKDKIGPRCVGWCLSGSRIDKSHPHSAMIISRIIREVGLPVVMFGAPGKEFDMAKYIMDQVEKHNGNHEGLHLALSPDPDNPSWPIRRLMTQINLCDIVVGPDTGPMWAVAVEHMPKVMLLSHASERNITQGWVNTISLKADPERVPCYPCHRLQDDFSTCTPNKDKTGAACITDISVETIVSTVRELNEER